MGKKGKRHSRVKEATTAAVAASPRLTRTIGRHGKQLAERSRATARVAKPNSTGAGDSPRLHQRGTLRDLMSNTNTNHAYANAPTPSSLSLGPPPRSQGVGGSERRLGSPWRGVNPDTNNNRSKADNETSSNVTDSGIRHQQTPSSFGERRMEKGDGAVRDGGNVENEDPAVAAAGAVHVDVDEEETAASDSPEADVANALAILSGAKETTQPRWQQHGGSTHAMGLLPVPSHQHQLHSALHVVVPAHTASAPSFHQHQYEYQRDDHVAATGSPAAAASITVASAACAPPSARLSRDTDITATAAAAVNADVTQQQWRGTRDGTLHVQRNSQQRQPHLYCHTPGPSSFTTPAPTSRVGRAGAEPGRVIFCTNGDDPDPDTYTFGNAPDTIHDLGDVPDVRARHAETTAGLGSGGLGKRKSSPVMESECHLELAAEQAAADSALELWGAQGSRRSDDGGGAGKRRVTDGAGVSVGGDVYADIEELLMLQGSEAGRRTTCVVQVRGRITCVTVPRRCSSDTRHWSPPKP